MWSEIEGLDGLIKFTGVNLIGRVVEWQCLGNNLHYEWECRTSTTETKIREGCLDERARSYVAETEECLKTLATNAR